jgi:hypothetical protein
VTGAADPTTGTQLQLHDPDAYVAAIPADPVLSMNDPAAPEPPGNPASLRFPVFAVAMVLAELSHPPMTNPREPAVAEHDAVVPVLALLSLKLPEVIDDTYLYWATQMNPAASSATLMVAVTVDAEDVPPAVVDQSAVTTPV